MEELFIDSRENSKSLAWSSIRLAFQNTEPGKMNKLRGKKR
ncbi:MAG: hypothetical protein Q4F41_09880 [Eubacteriales bacterium]|nr:hypothetical protein [Eubacteriales bacterium]